MKKLVASAILVLLAMTGVDRLALARVPGAGWEVLCELVGGFLASTKDGGALRLRPVSFAVSTRPLESAFVA
jgi:hypothetical protein